ncbi:hypothetical protein NM688_g1164 [Phlebia brevispora]|uniref:Uncharacterized protein n=1 Tax=Phlebia brevispora TaxID=194682 RepID=A0ACC1TC27_9APHY|nr:hypothetical protein NM688_g1164 [Phlebia brevispora]
MVAAEDTGENNEVIAVVIKPGIYVTGEAVEGEVWINFIGLRRTPVEEVHVKLRGSVFTKITKQIGDAAVTKRRRVELVRDTISLWCRGSGYPPAGSDILKLPFRFTLSPTEALPSCHYTGFHKSGRVMYNVEVVGVRSGWRLNKRLSNALAVLPPDKAGAELSRNMRLGEIPPWRSIKFQKSIRRGIWGEFSNVEATLSIPDLPTIPIFTAIPFVLSVVTVSKTTRKDDTPTDQPIFPAPPLTPQGVEFKLTRAVMVHTRAWVANGTDTVAPLGGLSPQAKDPHFYDEVQVENIMKTWIPVFGEEKKSKGSWRQQVDFRSTFKLTCPPTFTTETMHVKYFLNLKIAFPGIGNDLKTEIPIDVISSMLPPGSGEWDGPPPELDLPPVYFSSADVDHDEKDSE